MVALEREVKGRLRADELLIFLDPFIRFVLFTGRESARRSRLSVCEQLGTFQLKSLPRDVDPHGMASHHLFMLDLVGFDPLVNGDGGDVEL